MTMMMLKKMSLNHLRSIPTELQQQSHSGQCEMMFDATKMNDKDYMARGIYRFSACVNHMQVQAPRWTAKGFTDTAAL